MLQQQALGRVKQPRPLRRVVAHIHRLSLPTSTHVVVPTVKRNRSGPIDPTLDHHGAQQGIHGRQAPVLPLPTSTVLPARMGQSRKHCGATATLPVRILLPLPLIGAVKLPLQCSGAGALAGFGPTLARALRAFDDAIGLWPPRRIVMHAHVQAGHPHHQGRRQAAGRAPRRTVVHPQLRGAAPAGKGPSQEGLGCRHWHLLPGPLGGKRRSARTRRYVHRRAATNRPPGRFAAARIRWRLAASPDEAWWRGGKARLLVGRRGRVRGGPAATGVARCGRWARHQSFVLAGRRGDTEPPRWDGRAGGLARRDRASWVGHSGRSEERGRRVHRCGPGGANGEWYEARRGIAGRVGGAACRAGCHRGEAAGSEEESHGAWNTSRSRWVTHRGQENRWS